MHFEVPRVSLHSLREFASHYLMIVVSILTALGLEAVIENAHHRHAAESAQRAIEAEIRLNIADIRASIDKNRERTKPLAELDDSLAKAIEERMSARFRRSSASMARCADSAACRWCESSISASRPRAVRMLTTIIR